MRTRDYKSFAEGEIYHLFNRGNNKNDIFKTTEDYLLFLDRLDEYLHPNRRAPSAARYKRKGFDPGAFSLLCYCLMPNHFHFLIRQNSDTSLSELILRLGTSYSKYFNKKYERVGSLFQDQFKAVLIESNDQLLWTSAYIHLNPRVDGLVRDVESYPFSSYAEYQSKPKLCDTSLIMGQYPEAQKYKQFVLECYDPIKKNKGARADAEGALLHESYEES